MRCVAELFLFPALLAIVCIDMILRPCFTSQNIPGSPVSLESGEPGNEATSSLPCTPEVRFSRCSLQLHTPCFHGSCNGCMHHVFDFSCIHLG